MFMEQHKNILVTGTQEQRGVSADSGKFLFSKIL